MNEESPYKFTTTNRQFVEEEPWGMYVFKCNDGEVLGDGDGNVMYAFGFKNDPTKKKAVADAARHYGFGPDEGEVVYLPGRRPIGDEELAEQEFRMRMGLVPDPLDYGAMMDEMRGRKNGRN